MYNEIMDIEELLTKTRLRVQHVANLMKYFFELHTHIQLCMSGLLIKQILSSVIYLYKTMNNLEMQGCQN